MANIEYSADFRSAVDGLNEVAADALKKFSEQPAEAKTIEAQNDVGAKLRQINRLVQKMCAVVFPEMAIMVCNSCGETVRTEKAYWSGMCWNCGVNK